MASGDGRLRFAVITEVGDTTVTVLLDGALLVVPMQDGYGPVVGDRVWLGQQGRTLVIVGHTVSA